VSGGECAEPGLGTIRSLGPEFDKHATIAIRAAGPAWTGAETARPVVR